MGKGKSSAKKRVKVVSTRLTNAYWEKLHAICNRDGMKASERIRALIEKDLSSHQTQGGDLIGLLQALS